MGASKVLILLGSPRRNGNSSLLAEALAMGAEESGSQVETVFLHDLEIRPCTGCDACQAEEADGCILDDAMQGIYPRIRESGSIVFASPVYWFSVSAQLKTSIDRMYAIGGGDKNVLSGKNFGVLLAYADSDPFTSGAVNALRMFQDICSYIGATLTGAVYGSAWEAGEIAKDEELIKAARELGRKLGNRTDR